MMHYKKNLCENILKIIFGAKDLMIVRKDFKECGIKPHLWIQNVNGQLVKPVVSFVLLIHDKDKFIHTIINIKTLTFYALSLRKRITWDGDLKHYYKNGVQFIKVH